MRPCLLVDLLRQIAEAIRVLDNIVHRGRNITANIDQLLMMEDDRGGRVLGGLEVNVHDDWLIRRHRELLAERCQLRMWQPRRRVTCADKRRYVVDPRLTRYVDHRQKQRVELRNP